MLQIVAMKIKLALTAAILCCVSIARGDEQFFGFVRGAETLPAHRWEVYQFVTLGEGKSEGTSGWYRSLFICDSLQIRRALPQRCGCESVQWRLQESISSVENIAANMWAHCSTGEPVNQRVN